MLAFRPPSAPQLQPGAFDERRSAPRLPLNEITVWARGVPYRGRGDVSTGGCFWKGDAKPESLGKYAPVTFRIPTLGEEVSVIARILQIRSSAGMHAIHFQFDEVPTRIREALSRHSDEWFDIADASGLIGL